MGCWLSGPWMGDQTLSGRSLANLSQRDALRILAATQRPITMQIKGQRGCGTEHLNLPLPMMGAGHNASSLLPGQTLLQPSCSATRSL
ncbi:Afadin [Dissostichus eleginoides]|uniref:Afadin n=1 Tax=Dissostichus eleginoides TaxID=100907 RepID=A0AAD9CHG0_DISEL|nr:Afadin [Dissostichus eleginoides]